MDPNTSGPAADPSARQAPEALRRTPTRAGSGSPPRSRPGSATWSTSVVATPCCGTATCPAARSTSPPPTPAASPCSWPAGPTKLSDLVREPAALDEARRRARTIRAKTLELSEERGIAAGFIAIGMATWTVRGASRAPAAPVLLRSCVLKPTGAAQRGLRPRPRQRRRVQPGARALPALRAGPASSTPTRSRTWRRPSNGFDPLPRLCRADAACAARSRTSRSPRGWSSAPSPTPSCRWSPTSRHRVTRWPTTTSSPRSPATRARCARCGTQVPDVAGRRRPGPRAPHPRRRLHPAGRDRRGPLAAPTSSSRARPAPASRQTIANLIASLAGEGKRVLFVAEKRAAIDAVLGRLDGVGLGDLVLDAYDGASNKRRLAQEFGAALERGTATPRTPTPPRSSGRWSSGAPASSTTPRRCTRSASRGASAPTRRRRPSPP